MWSLPSVLVWATGKESFKKTTRPQPEGRDREGELLFRQKVSAKVYL